jgi:transposase
VTQFPDLGGLTHAEKNALILVLWTQVQALTARVTELEAKLGSPPKTPDNSSVPPSSVPKANRPEKVKRAGPRQGSLGRTGGGRALTSVPEEVVIARLVRCAHCQAALGEADQRLHGRYDKVELPTVAPVVTRVERYAGHCPCCGGTTLAPVPDRRTPRRGRLPGYPADPTRPGCLLPGLRIYGAGGEGGALSALAATNGVAPCPSRTI